MKKLLTIMVMALMVVGMMPFAFAANGDGTGIKKQDGSGNGSGPMLLHLEEHKEVRLAVMDVLSEQQRDRLMNIDADHARKLYEFHQERIGKIAELDAEQLERLGALDRARLGKFLEEHVDDLDSAVQKIKVQKMKKEDAFRNRAVVEEKMERAKERFEMAKENYGQAKKLFNEQKNAWQNAIGDGDEEGAVEHAKEYLHHAADMVIHSLEQVKEQAEGNDDLTPEEYDEIIADMDAKIAEMEGLQEQLALAETKEEVKAVGKDILSAWDGMRNRVRVHAENVVRTQVGEVLSRSEALEQHLDRILAEMEAENVSVDDLDEKLDDFSDLVDRAREKFANSTALFTEAKETDDKDLLNESKELSREAHEDLKEAHEILMDIVREVKAAGYDVEDDDEYVDVVEIDDDDSEEEDEEELEDESESDDDDSEDDDEEDEEDEDEEDE